MEDERCGKAVLERELKLIQGRVASLQAARTALTHKHQTATNVSYELYVISGIVDTPGIETASWACFSYYIIMYM